MEKSVKKVANFADKTDMEKPIAKLSRQNHMDHIISVLPLITAVFAVQCYLMSQFTSGVEIGDLAIGLACGLIAFVGGLFVYDKNHQIYVYPDHIRSGFGMFGGLKKISLNAVAAVVAPEEEKNFSSLILKMKDKRSHIFYFVDYPLNVKKLLDHQIDLLNKHGDKDGKDSQSDDSMAA